MQWSAYNSALRIEMLFQLVLSPDLPSIWMIPALYSLYLIPLSMSMTCIYRISPIRKPKKQSFFLKNVKVFENIYNFAEAKDFLTQPS